MHSIANFETNFAKLSLRPINDVLKGYAREVPQPPQLERHGCSPRDLVRGLEAIGASRMWRAATMFAESILARGCEIARDSGRGEVFEESEHMVPSDVTFFSADGARHARVRMRKRKDLRVLRGKQATVIVAGGGRIFDAAHELSEWMSEREALGIPASAPLFCHASGAMITVDELRDVVKAAGHRAAVCSSTGPVWVGSAREGITVSPVCYVRPHS